MLERRGFKRINPNLMAMACLSALFTGGIFIALRSIEYAPAFFALTLLLLLQELLEEPWMPRIFTKKGRITVLLGILSLAFAVCHTPGLLKMGDEGEKHPIPHIAAWMQENIRPNTSVINTDWSDFPLLFYYDPTHYYQWGLDPMFAFLFNKDKAFLLTSTYPSFPLSLEGGARTIAKEFGTEYAVILWPRRQQAQYLMSMG